MSVTRRRSRAVADKQTGGDGRRVSIAPPTNVAQSLWPRRPRTLPPTLQAGHTLESNQELRALYSLGCRFSAVAHKVICGERSFCPPACQTQLCGIPHGWDKLRAIELVRLLSPSVSLTQRLAHARVRRRHAAIKKRHRWCMKSGVRDTRTPPWLGWHQLAGKHDPQLSENLTTVASCTDAFL
eukprot:356091-Chlamydomonas_euryale.AAC.2